MKVNYSQPEDPNFPWRCPMNICHSEPKRFEVELVWKSKLTGKMHMDSREIKTQDVSVARGVAKRWANQLGGHVSKMYESVDYRSGGFRERTWKEVEV